MQAVQKTAGGWSVPMGGQVENTGTPLQVKELKARTIFQV